MIGYYVHHVGRGHLQRARALAAHLQRSAGPPLTVLSSLARPPDWPGGWVDLPRDDDGDPVSATARGRLHWAPLRHAGLRSRMATVAAWLERTRPDALVADVSVEVLLLARLHGVPVVGVVLPGRRDDAAHRLGFDIADELVAFWPPSAHEMLQGVPYETKRRVRCLGALSRFPVGRARAPRPTRRAVLLLGRGGHRRFGRPASGIVDGWSWTVLDGTEESWTDDPSAALRDADVVVTHAGQNALAETAAARRPAVVVPQERPHDEQRTTAHVLRDGGWPVVVSDTWPEGTALLHRAAALDGDAWAAWCDGSAARRFGDVVLDLAGSP